MATAGYPPECVAANEGGEVAREDPGGMTVAPVMLIPDNIARLANGWPVSGFIIGYGKLP